MGEKFKTLDDLWNENCKGAADPKLEATNKGLIYIFVAKSPCGHYIGWDKETGNPVSYPPNNEEWTLYVEPCQLIPHFHPIVNTGAGPSVARGLYRNDEFAKAYESDPFLIGFDLDHPVNLRMRNGRYVLANGKTDSMEDIAS